MPTAAEDAKSDAGSDGTAQLQEWSCLFDVDESGLAAAAGFVVVVWERPTRDEAEP